MSALRFVLLYIALATVATAQSCAPSKLDHQSLRKALLSHLDKATT